MISRISSCPICFDSSMSHTTLQKIRAKLSKESAKNIRLDGELRNQLAHLRETKRNRDLELQRELLVVMRTKALREAELIIQIQKTRRSSMMLDQQMKNNGWLPAVASPTATSWYGFGSSSPITNSPMLLGSDSFEEFQKEVQNNKMEQAHVMAEMAKIKIQTAQDSVNGTP